jgi:hypothetical protein
MSDQASKLAAAVDEVSDAYELRTTLGWMRRDQIGVRHDVAALRTDMTEGFGTMHMRFAAVHREMARIAALLEKLEQGDKAA